ncbi:hypothetical protein FPSE_10052 [Fusarium pseudograminearum CS3096]|uniref:Uncharacterized protein n=1 Tax=Fusarium pseudograminearum (strain CS3096) TaxID=1028729 RepID=K3UDV6_FUSPC|nr:hypothetical protein FPSE_10052 [Fusarium pseudograminearum CS3096]EKJ69736.1 hypothetical protein FPSE_10052 [Fusarium pseudograminearum CS3096]
MPAINSGQQQNDTSNQSNGGSSNALYTLLQAASNDNDAMHNLGSSWETLKTMVNVPFPDDENKTSLHLAAEKGFQRVVKKLLEDGAADSSMGDKDGWRPLHFACSAGHEAVVKELLSHKANPELTDSRGWNVLHIAITYGQSDTFQLIVERYPQLLEQSTTKSGMTPLHIAIWWSNEKIVKVCLKNKADISVRDNDGWTVLMMAAYKKEKGIMDTLIEHTKKKKKDTNISDHLDISDNEGKTCLMVACEEGWEQGVEDLSNEEASFDLLDNLGRTALHYAVMSGHLAIIETATTKMKYEFLLMVDANGRSAFDDFDFNQAADQQQQTHLDKIMNHFVKDVSTENPQREMLEWAAKGPNRSKIFRMLVKRLTRDDIFDNIDAKDPTIFEQAVHSRMPWVLWILIDNFSVTSETLESVQRAQQLANKLLQSDGKSKKLARTEHGDEKDESKQDPDRLILFDMQNYLSDFAVAETYRRSLYKPIKPQEGVDKVLRGFNVTITQFFDRRIDNSQHKTKWIKQWRPVQDVIYGKGPKRIAEDAMKTRLPYPQDGSKSSDDSNDNIEITTQLKWIHLPVTNIVWMEDLTKRILKERKLSTEQTQSFASFLRSSWVQVPDRTSASRFMRPLYVSKSSDETRSLAVSAAYMPYLSMSKYIPASSASEGSKGESLYKQLLEAYKDDVVHQSATLDESYYHFGSDEASRADQDARNRTQVVTKYLNGKKEEEEVKNEKKEKKKKNRQKKEDEQPSGPFNVVRVKQLWVWTILDVDEVQEDDLPKDFLNHPAIQEQITEAPSQPEFTARIATLIANYCVDAYERKRTSEQVDPSQRSDDSSSNSHIVREELSTRSIRQLFSDIVNENAREEKRLFSDCHNLTRLRKEGNDGKLEGILTQASQLACDIKDLRDELNMLRSIVNFQLTVQKEMPGNTKGSSSITGQYFSNDLEELENVAKRTQESVDTILTLAETEIANDQARQATRQGRTMMVFTVVTILFLPLSFLSSLFALSDKPFAETPSWVHVIIWTVSFTFRVPVASIALFSDAAAKQWNRIWSPMEQVVTKHWCDFQEKQEDKKELKELRKEQDEKKKKKEAREKKKDRLKRTLAEASRALDEMDREEEGLMNNRPDISPV